MKPGPGVSSPGETRATTRSAGRIRGMSVRASRAAMVTRVPIAVAALVRDGLVLLVHRHPSRKWYPDCWDLVGGHVESGESPHEAVVRECFEELGVQVHDPLPIAMTFNDHTLDVHAFLVTRWGGEPVNSAPEEHDDLR